MATVSKLVVSLHFAVTNHPLKLASYCAHSNGFSASVKAGTGWGVAEERLAFCEGSW
jgi:hypothetical protein